MTSQLREVAKWLSEIDLKGFFGAKKLENKQDLILIYWCRNFNFPIVFLALFSPLQKEN